MEIAGIVVAAGKGTRMGSDVPKQYLSLGGLPLLCHTILAFDACSEIDRILLVIPEGDAAFCRESLLGRLSLQHPIELIAGGEKRQDSVYRALQALPQSTLLVAVHDGVRPLVSPEHIRATIRCAEKDGAAVLAIPATETLKRVDEGLTIRETLARSRLWIAQTPQCFHYRILRQAHEKAAKEAILATDDAQLVERTGYPVKIIQGSRFNLKVTTPEDLKMAEALYARLRS